MAAASTARRWSSSATTSSLVVLAGGLGGSRCVHSLALAAGPESVTAIGNVGDDLELLGLHVSPDLDTILYTLAGLLDEERGWGVRDETYSALALAERLGEETWFTLGDRDIGLHLVRTSLLRAGVPLSEVTRCLAERLGVGVRLLPASDDRLRTRIQTAGGELDFQDWFVRRRHTDPVEGVRYEGAESAAPAPGILEAIAEAEVVLIAPSNPFVSIEPILAVPGIRDALAAKRVAAVSPLVGGRALRGPLADMMTSLGHEPTARGVAELYGDVVSTFVLDSADAELAAEIPGAVVADTVMVDPARRAEVGRGLLEALR
jgi:LPPG:FO 2-phospho-L-lactate transferase